MKDHRVEHLANFLVDANGSLVVTHDYSNQRIDVPTYRKKRPAQRPTNTDFRPSVTWSIGGKSAI